jgi:serine O-acetyltransferase
MTDACEKVIVSATVADWFRERVGRGRWDPARRLLRCIRSYQGWKRRGGLVGRSFASLCVLRYRFWSAVTGAEIPLMARIEGGLLLPHPNGVVIHPDVRIGPNGLIFQQVTLGSGGPIPGVPTVGGHVDIGAGAKILGGVVIGDHAKIGANAVVLDHVPAGATAVGIPARIVYSVRSAD